MRRGSPIDLEPNDPLLAYLLSDGGIAELDRLRLDSNGLRELRAAGVKLALPLIAQGELIGILNIGPRLSDKEYSGDDRRLLEHLAAQAAPALRVAQLVREQESEALSRARNAQELRVADVMRELLPDSLPNLEGWDLHAYYRAAPDVGGDFYDFVPLDGGRLGIVIAGVADRGIRAAMVMATARTLLRLSAEQLIVPRQVLERVNDQLRPSLPPKVFVTCLYAVLDSANGHLVYGNAGHNPPYIRSSDARVSEMRAEGLPLGLVEHTQYAEKEVQLAPGDNVLFQSDGLAEAHNQLGENFGLPRIKTLLAEHTGQGAALLTRLVNELESFTGLGWTQEDDLTLVALQWAPSASDDRPSNLHPNS
jgi:serine phosphatase RsbU (regulator of sigma subunit)